VREILADREDELKKVVNKTDMEDAMKNQKIEFLNQKLEDTKKLMDENKAAYDQMMSAFQSREADKSKEQSETKTQIENLKKQHIDEIGQINKDHEGVKNRL